MYFQAKLVLGGLSLCQNVKVPFVLLPPQIPDDPDPYPPPKSETEEIQAIATTSTEVTPSVGRVVTAETHHHGSFETVAPKVI